MAISCRPDRARMHSIMPGFAYALQFLFLSLLFMTLVAGETTSIRLKEPNPLFRQNSLLLANAALVLVVVAQAVRTVLRKRKKFQVAEDYEPGQGKDQTVAKAKPDASQKTTTKPKKKEASTKTVSKPAAASIVVCPNCETKVKVKSPKRPVKFKCPKCSEVSVAK